MELFQIRIIILLTLFAIASVYDYNTRKIPDVLWIVFAGIGGVLYVIDYETFSAYHIISFFTSCVFAFVIYRMKFVGMADVFGIMSISVILPVHYEFVMVPILGTILALILAVFAIILYNVTLNVTDMISRKRKSLFCEFQGESLYRKIFAVFFVHRKREYEKFVISSENQYPAIPKNRSFVLISRNKEISPQMEGFVQNAPPFVLFMMVGLILLLFPEILELIIIEQSNS
ncbi:MAG: prepilin peptidase [Nitrosopumilus sp.]|nr:prepilin peptidase [Nitrosopumilus sp.]